MKTRNDTKTNESEYIIVKYRYNEITNDLEYIASIEKNKIRNLSSKTRKIIKENINDFKELLHNQIIYVKTIICNDDYSDLKD